jgi:hypothetical protein
MPTQNEANTDVVNNLLGFTKRFNGGGVIHGAITPNGVPRYAAPNNVLLSTNETAHIGPIHTQTPQELQVVAHYGGPIMTVLPGDNGKPAVRMSNAKNGNITTINYPNPNTPLIGVQQKQDVKTGFYDGTISAGVSKILGFLFGA